VPAFAGKGTAKPLLDAKATGSEAVTVNLLEFPINAEVPATRSRSIDGDPVRGGRRGQTDVWAARTTRLPATVCWFFLPASPTPSMFMAEKTDKAEKPPRRWWLFSSSPRPARQELRPARSRQGKSAAKARSTPAGTAP